MQINNVIDRGTEAAARGLNRYEQRVIDFLGLRRKRRLQDAHANGTSKASHSKRSQFSKFPNIF